jgi:hypothetical protein
MTDHLLGRLLNLNVAKDRKGMAPLVLAILDLIEAGLVAEH